MIVAKCIDMVINKCFHAVASHRVEGAYTILDTCKSVLLGAYPQTSIISCGHDRDLMTGQRSIVTNDAFIASAIPDLTALILCQCRDVSNEISIELVDIAAIISETRLLSTNPKQVGIVYIYTLNTDNLLILQSAVGTARLHIFHLVVIDGRAD